MSVARVSGAIERGREYEEAIPQHRGARHQDERDDGDDPLDEAHVVHPRNSDIQVHRAGDEQNRKKRRVRMRRWDAASTESHLRQQSQQQYRQNKELERVEMQGKGDVYRKPRRASSEQDHQQNRKRYAHHEDEAASVHADRMIEDRRIRFERRVLARKVFSTITCASGLQSWSCRCEASELEKTFVGETD